MSIVFYPARWQTVVTDDSGFEAQDGQIIYVRLQRCML